MYEGDWARRFVEVIQRAGGKITLEDMKRYRAIWEDPLQTTFHEYQAYATGRTPWGGVNIIQGLNLLDGGLHAKTLQVLVNILEFGMDTQAAVDAPAFVGWGPGQVEADTFDPKVLAGLREMGLKVELDSPKQAAISRGYWAGVAIDPVTRRITGGVSSGMEGEVAAY